MEQLWSHEQLVKEFGRLETVGLLIRRLEELTWSKGEVICQVRINGELLSEDQEREATQWPFERIRKIEILTDRPGNLLRETIRSQRELLAPLKAEAFRLSEAIRVGEVADLAAALMSLLDACRWLTEGLALVKSLGEDQLEENAWGQAEAQYQRALVELTTAVERNDLGLAADCLEYEVTNAFDAWLSVLDPLLARQPQEAC